MRIALAILMISFSARAASIRGVVIDPSGTLIPHAAVELDSGTSKYTLQTDNAGVYLFADLPAGEYTMSFRLLGFKTRWMNFISLSEREEKRIPDVTLTVGSPCAPSTRDLVQQPSGVLFGQLRGSVSPPVANVEVTLVCRTFHACASTQTDSNGHFSFEMISAGVYGLNFRRNGFYPVNATGYAYTVDDGWESVYSPISLVECPKGNCAVKPRPLRQPIVCE